jgi:hypothetical protein
MIKQFNDLLALVLVALIVMLWILQGLKVIEAQLEISGATIATFTLVVQYYFRKAPANGTTATSAAPAGPAAPADPSAPPGGGTK